MKNYLFFLIYILISFPFFSQSEDDDQSKKAFLGINIGAYRANNNTAILYNGNTSTYGVGYYFSNSYFKAELDQYFKYQYRLESFTGNDFIQYNTAFNVGFHAGLNLSQYTNLYTDINIVKLNVTSVFTVAIYNPNQTNVIGETLEQIPIYGEESRSNINVGIQHSFYQQNATSGYINCFGNINDTGLEKNYFIINGKTYSINHNVVSNGTNNNGQLILQQNRPPGGIGFGGGAGIGVKQRFNDQFIFDLNYYATYTKINLGEQLQPFGLQHSIVARIIWG